MTNLFCMLINTATSIYIWIIIIASLMTFFQPNQYNPAVQFIYKITEPVFAYTRKYLPFLVISGMDLSPIVIILALQYLPRIICQLIY